MHESECLNDPVSQERKSGHIADQLYFYTCALLLCNFLIYSFQKLLELSELLLRSIFDIILSQ